MAPFLCINLPQIFHKQAVSLLLQPSLQISLAIMLVKILKQLILLTCMSLQDDLADMVLMKGKSLCILELIVRSRAKWI